jgi:hypothetical protein
MVEITIPIVLQLIQTAGILVGMVYYITIIRNAQKARRAENLQWFLEDRSDEECMLQYAFVQSLEWEDYDDFQKKYGRKQNPEAWAKLWSYLVKFDDIGLMVNRGVIDIKDLYELSGRSMPALWRKYQPIFEEDRKRGDPTSMGWFEYLFDELYKESKRRRDNYLEDLTSLNY